jgi:hypothetical protein
VQEPGERSEHRSLPDPDAPVAMNSVRTFTELPPVTPNHSVLSADQRRLAVGCDMCSSASWLATRHRRPKGAPVGPVTDDALVVADAALPSDRRRRLGPGKRS